MFLQERGDPQIQERCSYFDQASEGVSYELTSFKLHSSKILRKKIFNWGISKLEGVIS